MVSSSIDLLLCQISAGGTVCVSRLYAEQRLCSISLSPSLTHTHLVACVSERQLTEQSLRFLLEHSYY